MPYLDDLARLRCEVFREYPYLYDGDTDAERAYLANYAGSEHVFLVLARFEGEIVGVSTCMPMAEADPAFQAPFVAREMLLDEICYFGESVLLPEFRGLGVGHRYFDLRERWSSVRGFTKNTFCSVIRPDDHPDKPVGYRQHDSLWTKRGYRRHDELIGELDWRESGDAFGTESSHKLVFWMKG